MVRYFYAWAPLVVVGAVLLLSLPWLGLVALAIFALVALGVVAALAWAVLFVPYMFGRAIVRGWHSRAVARARMAPAVLPADSAPRAVPAGATAVLASSHLKRSR